jgi:hypothetical protein
MRWRNPLALFFCRVVVIYLILAAPWPGVARTYGNCFRAICRMVFATDNERRELSFETAGEGSPRPNDTRVVIVNKALMHPDGSGPVRNLDINLGWQSPALLVALILSTPISWARKRWALLWGLVGIHGFLLAFLAFCIWAESSEIALVEMSPFWKGLVHSFREALTGQVNLGAPVLTWLLVTFRREDWAALSLAEAKSSKVESVA